jgi:hypothetical protein
VQNSATFYVNLAPSATETSTSSSTHPEQSMQPHHTYHPLTLYTDVLEAQLPLTVDSTQSFSFTFYSPNDQSVKLSLKDPQGNSVILQGQPVCLSFCSFPSPFSHPLLNIFTILINQYIDYFPHG